MAAYMLIDRAPYDRFSGVHAVQPIARDLPPSGEGYLSGSYPDGITRIKGEPSSCQVRVLYRPDPSAPGDGVLVAEVTSGVDGTWRVDGLDPELTFDVIFRYPGYNDMILSQVKPTPYVASP